MKLPPLYKYLDVNGARLTLKNQTFRHAKPSDFNDSEDMTTSNIFPYDINTACEKIKDDLIDCIIRNSHKNPSHNNSMYEYILKLQKFLCTPEKISIAKIHMKNEKSSSIYDLDHLNDISTNFLTYINKFLQKFRVFCISELIDSNKMWEDYAEKHSGIALRLQPNAQRNSKFTLLQKVSYKEKRPILYDNIASFLDGALFGSQTEIAKIIMEKIIYTKTLKWAHEKEYRLAIPILDGESDWNTQKFISDEISEIYLGAKMSNEVKEEILRLAKMINPLIKIYQAHIDEHGKIFFSN